MKDDKLILMQFKLNFTVIGGMAALAAMHFQTGHERLAIAQVEALMKFREQNYFCSAEKTTDKKVGAAVKSKMHKDFLAFSHAMGVLLPAIHGAITECSPTVEEAMAAQGLTLGQNLSDREKVQAITQWFVDVTCKDFNNSQEMFD